MFTVIVEIISLLKSLFKIGDIVTDLYQTWNYEEYSKEGGLYDECAPRNGSNSTETLSATYVSCAEVIWFLPPMFAVLCGLCLGGSRPNDPRHYYLSKWVWESMGEKKKFPVPPKIDNNYANFLVEIIFEFFFVGFALYIMLPLVALMRTLNKLLQEMMNVDKILGTATKKSAKEGQKTIDEGKEIIKAQRKLERYLTLMQLVGEMAPQIILTWIFLNNEKEFLLKCGESDVFTINDTPVPLTLIFSIGDLIMAFCDLFAFSCTYLWKKCMGEEET